MSRVHPCSLPADALLARYAGAGYVDCYTAEVRRDVSHAEYVEAFYTGSVFKLERYLLDAFKHIFPVYHPEHRSICMNHHLPDFLFVHYGECLPDSCLRSDCQYGARHNLPQLYLGVLPAL